MPDYEYRNPLNEEAEAIEIRHLGDLAGEMVYRLPGYSPLMIRKELQRAWVEFANRTGVLRFQVKTALVAGKRKYGFGSPVPATISRVWDIHFAYEDENGAVHHDPHQLWDKVGYANNGERATVILDFDIGEDDLQGRNRLCCLLECRPLVAGEDIPAPIYARWGHAIVAGAMAHLCSLGGGRPWADTALAQQSLIEFQNAMGEASRAAMGNGRGDISVVNREGWA